MAVSRALSNPRTNPAWVNVNVGVNIMGLENQNKTQMHLLGNALKILFKSSL
jgi:hypothetical protein